MGFQKLDVVGGNGFTWALSTLKQIDKAQNGQTLASFKLPTDQGFGSGDTIVLEIYGEDGTLEGDYSFVDEANASTYGLTKTGWYPLELMQQWMATDADCANDTVIPYGKGVIITSGEADTELTFMGEVVAEATQIPVTGGNSFTWTGNATPVDLTLGDFALPTDEGFGSGDTIVLEIYGADGTLQGDYSFVDEANASTYGLTETGWYPLELMQQWMATDADCANDVPVPAGKMVIITSGEADTTLTLPNPIPAA